MLAVSAVTFDDFNTLRYSIEEEEDIIHPIRRVLKRNNVNVDEEDFLCRYFKADKAYRESLQETFRESLLDDIIRNVLLSLGYRSPRLDLKIEKAVNEGLATRKATWYSDAIPVLTILRKRGFRLGLITNTHWRLTDETKKVFNRYFDVITLSYEHGYAKPHPSIFLTTLDMLGTSAKNCLHVGDDPVADIQGAKKVGMKTAFIKRGKKKTNANMQIEQLSELPEFLQILKSV